jgi:ABC-type amino acid transport substrate-binding protein
LLIRALITVAVALAMLSAWLILRGGGDSSLERIMQSGVLRVGIEGDNPPFAVLVDNEVVGLDVDLARALAAALGIDAHFVIMGYDSLYDALDVGLVDALISALRVDPDRMDEVHYTRHYFNAGQVLVSREGTDLSGTAALEGRTVAVEFGSDGDVWARRWQRRLSELTVRPYDAPVAALDALARGEVDAAIVDAISARSYLQASAEAVILETLTDDLYAVATRRESARLWRALDEALAGMIADRRLEALIARWL